MAAIVTGLIPILRTAVDATTNYKCRSLWFGFLSIRLVILFLAEMPFSKLASDFSCNMTRDSLCVNTCFNEILDKPMMVAWNFIFVLLVISVLLMEFFTSYLRSLSKKRSSQAKTDVELESQGREEGPGSPAGTKGRVVLDLHQHREMVAFYLFSIFLRLLVELWFLYVLLFWNLPVLEDKLHSCKSSVCSEPVVCVVRAAPEKRMSIYALASISGLLISTSVIFALYIIVYYICKQ